MLVRCLAARISHRCLVINFSFWNRREIDGHDLMELLQGRAERSKHEFLFHYCNSYMNAVRWRPHNSKSEQSRLLPDFKKENSLFFFPHLFLLSSSFIHSSSSGSSVWKAFYFTPNFYPENGTACFHTHVCFCTAAHVTYHDPPLLFELSRDPSETTPLTPRTEPAFHAVLRAIEEAVEVHRRTVKPVESQLSLGNVMWKPWLQPCRSSLGQLCL